MLSRPNCCTARTASPDDPDCVVTTSAGQVCGPTMPSAVSPAPDWNAVDRGGGRRAVLPVDDDRMAPRPQQILDAGDDLGFVPRSDGAPWLHVHDALLTLCEGTICPFE